MTPDDVKKAANLLQTWDALERDLADLVELNKNDKGAGLQISVHQDSSGGWTLRTRLTVSEVTPILLARRARLYEELVKLGVQI